MASRRISQLALITLLTSIGVMVSLMRVMKSFDISLAKGLAQTTETPTTEANRLYEQGIEHLGENQVEAAIKSWQEALRLYWQNGDKKGEANTLRKLGDAYNFGLQQYEKAREFYQQSVELAREIGDKEIEARSLNNWGLVYKNLNQHEKSIKFFEQSLTLAREIDNKQIKHTFVNNLGYAYQSLKQYEKAIEYYEQGLAIAREIGDRQVEAFYLSDLAVVYLLLEQYNKTIEYHQQRLAIVREIRDKQAEASSLFALGTAHLSLGQYTKAREFYEQSLAIASEIEYRKVETESLRMLGRVYLLLGQSFQGIEYFRQSLAIARKIEDKKGESESLNNLGGAYRFLSQYDKSIEFYEQSLAIAREIRDKQGEAVSLYDLGQNYRLLGEYQKAIEYLKDSLDIARKIEHRQSQALSLSNLGMSYLILGEYQKAIESYQESLKISREGLSKNYEVFNLDNLGNVYSFLGAYQKAIKFYQQSLNINRDIENKQGEASSLHHLGNAYRSLGQYQKAIESYQQSLTIARKIENRRLESSFLNDLGNAYRSQGQYQKAIESYQQSLNIVRQIRDRQKEAIFLNNLGNVYRSQGQYQKAIEYYQQSLTISREIGSRSEERTPLFEEGTSLFALGLTYYNLQQYAEAEKKLDEAIKVWEFLRQDLINPNKVSIFDGIRQDASYLLLQEVLVAQNKTNKALEISERGRYQALIDFLKAKRSSPTPPISKEQIKAISSQKKATLVEYSIVADKAAILDAEGKIQWLTNPNYQKLYIWVITPDGKINFRQLDLTNLNQVLSDLEDKNLTLSELIDRTHQKITKGMENTRSVTNSNSLIPNVGDYIKLKDQDSELSPYQVVEINLDTQTVTLTNREFEGDITIEIPLTEIAEIVSSTATQDKRLQELHQLFIAPIADLLPTNPEEKVIFIPQSSLFNVPFPALQDKDGQYLIEKHTILTAPSIQVLDLTRQLKEKGINTKDILVVGNPTMPKVSQVIGEKPTPLSPLPHAEKEAIIIASRYETQPFIGSQATEAKITQLMPNARIMHFATHGILDAPGIGSAIALTPSGDKDGLLTAVEIFDMKLNAQLVVLSACETGRGPITGEGVIGLSRSLVAAGVESLIVSLWNVDDEATGELMVEFYNQWDKMGNKAQALRQAMLTTMKTHPEPKYWAAFTLIGEDE